MKLPKCVLAFLFIIPVCSVFLLEPITAVSERPTSSQPAPCPVDAEQDLIPPVIKGAANLKCYLGDPIVYKAGILVTDNASSSPKLLVDHSQVNTGKAGTYPVTYTATDDAGNSSHITVQLTLSPKPTGYIEPEVVNQLAEEILEQITTEDMNQMEIAFAIYNWTKNSIRYTGLSDKQSWTGGAYHAFTQRSGDCFNYFAAAKALYLAAGIENVDVVRRADAHYAHYWSLINLGDGWYHVDCTPRTSSGQFFMVTDQELESYSVQNQNSHSFDGSLYPARSEKSVQEKIDYQTGRVRG